MGFTVMQTTIKERYTRFIGSLSIKKKFYLGFGIILALMTITVLSGIFNIFNMKLNIVEVVDEHEPTVFATSQLSQQIEQASSALGFYLLSKEHLHKIKFKENIKLIDASLKILREKENIQKDDVANNLLNKITKDINVFKEHQNKLFEYAQNDSSNFPGLKYAAENLNPLSRNMLQHFQAMIIAEKHEVASSKRKEILLTIEELRYQWTKISNTVRLYLTFREEGNIKLINEVMDEIQILIKKLNNFGDDLGLEQEEDLENVVSIREIFITKFSELIKIHSSEEWRQDAYSIRTEVGPLLRNIQKNIKLLQNIQREKIDTASSSLISQSNSAIIFSLIFLIMAISFAVAITVELIRNILTPLNDAVKATDLITSGDLSVSLNDSANDEIGHLGKSFNMMVKKFQNDIDLEKQNSENLEEKVYLIAGVVELAAKGDLTGTIELPDGDDDFISALANNVQTMLDNLNDLVSQVQRSGIQVTSSTTEIAATAKQQEATVTEQAATANEISTTAQEISATSQELVNTMGEVTQVVEGTANEAANSQVALNEMESTMQQMMEATTNISAKLSVLSEKAANINSVVTTITKVADQTNLLSLNAAIEAEKAGEYGAGFSVVATEIRRLADQTAVATWDIEQMVKEMQTAVSAGVMGMDKFSEEVRGGVNDVQHVGAQLADIIDAVQEMLPSIEAVHEGMQNQSLGAQQINESISQLSDGTQQTADSLRQSGGALSQLNDAARALQSGVSIFKVK